MGITEQDMRIAHEIWQLLKTDLPVVMSWGIDTNSILPVKNGLKFHVQGFIHEGYVIVTLNKAEDLYELQLVPDDNSESKTKITDIYFDQLISIIDENVEKVENYEERIIAEYSLSK